MMITPGFFSFYNTQRALMTSQNALNIVNQNISNANTPGYSRQRAEITAYAAYPGLSVNGMSNGQMGQGSTMQSIERLRSQFLDSQFRLESSASGFAGVKTDVLKQIESILAEPTDSGISSAMQKFFESAQELSVHPESVPVRQTFIQAAAELLSVAQQQGRQLQDLRSSLVGNPDSPDSFAISQANVVTSQINDKLKGITDLNREILSITASGAQPNDLLDRRDQLLDELSKLTDIDVVQRDNGLVDVYLGKSATGGQGVQMVRGGEQVRSLQYVQRTTAGNPDFDVPGTLQTYNLLTNTAETGDLLNDDGGVEITSGSLSAILKMGRGGAGAAPPTVRTVFENINSLMTTFITAINNVQRSPDAATLDGLGTDANGLDLYTVAAPAAGDDPAGLLSHTMGPAGLNPRLVAAGWDTDALTGWQTSGVGDNRNALAFVDLQNQLNTSLGNTKFNDYFNSMLSGVGIASSSSQERNTAQANVVNSIDQQRSSISGVNVDEELVDLIRFQRSFEASSKVMSVLDQIMQTLINMTN